MDPRARGRRLTMSEHKKPIKVRTSTHNDTALWANPTHELHKCYNCIFSFKFPSGPKLFSCTSSLLQLQLPVLKFWPHFRHMPLHPGPYTEFIVISRCTLSLMFFEMSICFCSGGKYSWSSMSISASSSSSSPLFPEVVSLSSPNITPLSIVSGSSRGLSVSKSENSENMLSADGAQYLQKKITLKHVVEIINYGMWQGHTSYILFIFNIFRWSQQ